VEAEQEVDPRALVLVIKWIVLMDPVGDPGFERFGKVKERSNASL
jgi:hypothetical protein